MERKNKTLPGEPRLPSESSGDTEGNSEQRETANERENLPSTAELEKAYRRSVEKLRFFTSMRSTIFSLVIVAAVAVLVVVTVLPFLRVYGESMKTTIQSGDIVVSVRTNDLDTGDVIAFYYNNNILVKRVIAKSGDWVDIDEDGNVYVNDKELVEPYVSRKAYGETNIDLPYQVPDGKIFVMGDNRSVSIDSRNTSIGCISSEQIVGKIIFRIWPLTRLGSVQ
ncbi:MAG: signal peptidase I [Eubacteriales bacterium]